MAPQTYQMVRLVNKGDKDFTDGFASQTYTIKAHSEGFVPFDAACLWFGHPDAYDVSPRQRARTDMYRRLRQRYGAFDTVEKKGNDDVPVSGDEMWERNRPRVEVYSLEGDQIITVIDDPEGTNVTAADQTQAEQAGLLGRLEALEREGEILRGLLKSQRAAEDNDDGDDEDDDTEDEGDGEGGESKDEQPSSPKPSKSTTKRQGKPDPRGQRTPGNEPNDGPTATLLQPTKLSGENDAEPDSPNRPGVQRP